MSPPYLPANNLGASFDDYGTFLGPPFFDICSDQRLGAKMLDFGSSVAPSWAQNGAQNRLSGDQTNVNLAHS